jgi:hypothetical protein
VKPVGCQRIYIPQWRRLVVSKLVPALALILLAGPVCALAADAPSSAPASDAKSTTHAKKHHAKKKKAAATSSAPDSK